MRNKIGALLAVLLLLCGTVQRTHDGFTLATAPYTFVFPRDHYAHDGYRTEWWYFTGHLRSPDGHRFGYELTFFRAGLLPTASAVVPGGTQWRAAQLYPAHFAITDESNGRFVYYQSFARDALAQGGARENALEVWSNQWRLTGSAALLTHMRVHARVAGDALDLSEIPQKSPAIHGHGGISQKAACVGCASHYYSFTRLTTSGTLVRAGVRYRVDGISWMDHEFGSDELQHGQSGWDWFSIQLDDRREIMFYRLRQADGATTPQSSGSLVERNGRVRYLALKDVRVDATGTWTSPHTHANYPSGWRLSVRGIDHELALTPVLKDQELVDTAGRTTYWEGAVEVRDAVTGRRLGVGYVELTGYAGALTI